MESLRALCVMFLFAVVQFQYGLALPITGPAFLWSSHHPGSSDYDVKEIVNYGTISLKDLAKTVLSEGGWSNLVCAGEDLPQSLDIALVFIGRKLQSSDISRNKHKDQDLINLLKDSFTSSNFSIAFPYVDTSDARETMESSLLSGFSESCAHQSRVNEISVLESCSVEGAGHKKLASLQAVHDYVGSRMQTRQKEQTDVIVFCNGGSQASDEFEHTKLEGKILYEFIDLLKQSGAKYAVLYASDPYRSVQDYSSFAIKRFLGEGNGPANSTRCDRVCQIKSSLLEGIFVGIVLLIILLSGLCCMMGIDTPTRFETPQD